MVNSVTFSLHPQLAADTHLLADLKLSRLLLMNQRAVPWVILVPRIPDMREIHELSPEDQAQLLAEITTLSRHMAACFKADKINVAALGNMVPQLHIHIVARFTTDPAWPKPVWGNLPPSPYSEAEFAAIKPHFQGVD